MVDFSDLLNPVVLFKDKYNQNPYYVSSFNTINKVIITIDGGIAILNLDNKENITRELYY